MITSRRYSPEWPGCNPMGSRLRPSCSQAATQAAPRLQPCVLPGCSPACSQAATPMHPGCSPACSRCRRLRPCGAAGSGSALTAPSWQRRLGSAAARRPGRPGPSGRRLAAPRTRHEPLRRSGPSGAPRRGRAARARPKPPIVRLATPRRRRRSCRGRLGATAHLSRCSGSSGAGGASGEESQPHTLAVNLTRCSESAAHSGAVRCRGCVRLGVRATAEPATCGPRRPHAGARRPSRLQSRATAT